MAMTKGSRVLTMGWSFSAQARTAWLGLSASFSRMGGAISTQSTPV
jgi:hypothetical protein